jgi:hypothetical protein
MNSTVWKPYFTANGILTSGEFLIGTSLNLLCLTYFIRKRSSAINLIFKFISGTDLALSSIMAFSAISAFRGGRPLMFENALFCNVWGLIWHTGCGFSIFLMAALAVIRWIGLAHPWRRIKRRYVTVSVLIYLTIQLFKSTMNYWYTGNTYTYNALFLGCSVSNINVKEITITDKALFLLLYVFEVILPGIPAVIFSIATFIFLLKKDKERNSLTAAKRRSKGTEELGIGGLSPGTEGSEKKRDATVTILILLGTYLTLNVWFWMLTLGDAFYIFSDKALNYTTMWNGDLKSYYITYYVVYIHTVVLNSSANAVIYIVRLKGIKSYILYLVGSSKEAEVYSNVAVLMKRIGIPDRVSTISGSSGPSKSPRPTR